MTDVVTSVKVGIEKDERWPDYRLCEPDDVIFPEGVVDVPAATVERWRAAATAYEQAQNEMEAVLEAAEDAR